MQSVMILSLVGLCLLTLSAASPVQLSTAARAWSDGPCGKRDTKCMCAMAVKYVNKVRARAPGNPAPLAMGTEYMLQNALQHSRKMMNGGRAAFEHQPISSPQGVWVGRGTTCEAMLTGENIAQNWVVPSGSPDPAKKCVDAWEKSPGHYRNMVGDHVNTVIGILVDDRDYIWCTQTFSGKPAGKSGMCKPVSTGPGQPAPAPPAPAPPAPEPKPAPPVPAPPAPEPKPAPPAPAPKAEPRPVQPPVADGIKHQYFIVKKTTGKTRALIKTCRNGVCKFCEYHNRSKCWTPGASRFFDQFLTNYGL